jgi:CheY-like chemotaxis protein
MLMTSLETRRQTCRILLVEHNPFGLSGGDPICPPATRGPGDPLPGVSDPTPPVRKLAFRMDVAHQRLDGEVMVRQAMTAGAPYALVLFHAWDIGAESIETIRRLRANDPELQIIFQREGAAPVPPEILRHLVETDRVSVLDPGYSPARAWDLVEFLCQQWLLRQELLRATTGRPTRGTAVSQNAATAPVILLGEDSPINQRLAKAQFERLGYQVDIASNGREVLEAMSRRPYPLIFIDGRMPEMGGCETTMEIRRREQSRAREVEAAGERAYIIAMTASSLPADRERYFAAGIDDYLSKPVLLEDLEAALKRWKHRVGAPA